jgi:hypothetical protein
MLNFQTSGDKKAEAIAIMDTIIPMIKSQKGCKDCMFIMHESDNQYALLVFWETMNQADAAAPVIGPRLLPALNQITKEVVVPRLYEVYQQEPVVAQ